VAGLQVVEQAALVVVVNENELACWVVGQIARKRSCKMVGASLARRAHDYVCLQMAPEAKRASTSFLPSLMIWAIFLLWAAAAAAVIRASNCDCVTFGGGGGGT